MFCAFFRSRPCISLRTVHLLQQFKASVVATSVTIVVCLAACAAGQTPRNAPLSPDQFEAKRRNEEEAEYQAIQQKVLGLKNAGHKAAAVAAAREMLQVEARLFGESSHEALLTWEWIAGLLAEIRDMKGAIDARRHVVAIAEIVFKEKPWEIASAKVQLAHAQNLGKLSGAQWAEYDKAGQEWNNMMTHWRAGELEPAIAAAVKTAEMHRQLLGREDYMASSDLFFLGRILFDARNFQGAEEVFTFHLETERSVCGEIHPRVASVLGWIGKAQGEAGKPQAALEYYLKALAISRQVRPKGDDALGDDLGNAAHAHEQLGHYKEALALYEELLEQGGNEVSVDVAKTQVNIGAVHYDMNDNKQAQQWYERAIATLQTLPAEATGRTFTLAAVLSNTGALCLDVSDFAAARKHLDRALEICRENETDELADAEPAVYNQLGHLEASIGNMPGAIRFQAKAYELARQRWGDEHPTTATLLHDLGQAYWQNGDLATARQWLEEAMRIRIRTLGEDHELVARSLAELAFYVGSMGDLKQAAEYAEFSILVAKRAAGEDSVVAAYCYQNAALLMGDLNQDLPRALELMTKSLEIRRRMQGPDHPDTAQALGNYASLLRSNGKLPQAQAAYEESLAIDRKIYGDKSAELITSLFNLAVLAQEQNKLEEAQRYFTNAASIARSTLPADHPKLAMCISRLAYCEGRLGKFAESRRLFNEAFAVRERMFASQLPRLSVEQMQDYARTAGGELDALLSLPADDIPGEEVATWVLRLKSPAFQTLCRLRSVEGATARDPDLAQMATGLRAERERLARLTIRPPQGYSAEEIASEIRKLERNVATDEAQFNIRLAQVGAAATPIVTTQAIAANLPADSALVEIIKYASTNYQAAAGEPMDQGARYAAFIVFADREKPVERIELGDAAEIDERVANIAQQFKQAREWYKSTTKLTDEPTLEAEYREEAAALSARLVEPLTVALGNVRLVYLAPDSELHGLPFEALLDRQGNYLVESGYRFAYLTTGRDLLAADHAPGQGTAVFAGPNYDLLATSPRPTEDADEFGAIIAILKPLETGLAQGEPAPPRASNRSRDTRGLSWEALPGAVAEGEEAAKQFGQGRFAPVSKFVGDTAREDSFKQIHDLRALIIVTHGYFLERQPADEASELMNDAPARTGAGAAIGLGRLRSAENPLLRSGLILAGANHAEELPASDAAVEDGWVTAYEIAGLDLRGVELAVLSACNSGRGRTANGEAIAGLRTAFLSAGVKSLVASLFEVPDEETAAMMKEFYASVCGGASPLESLNQAELSVIEKRRATSQAAHPFFWASFVLAGKP